MVTWRTYFPGFSAVLFCDWVRFHLGAEDKVDDTGCVQDHPPGFSHCPSPLALGFGSSSPAVMPLSSLQPFRECFPVGWMPPACFHCPEFPSLFVVPLFLSSACLPLCLQELHVTRLDVTASNSWWFYNSSTLVEKYWWQVDDWTGWLWRLFPTWVILWFFKS